MSVGLVSVTDCMRLPCCWHSVRCTTSCKQMDFCSAASAVCAPTAIWGNPRLFVTLCSPCIIAPFQCPKCRGRGEGTAWHFSVSLSPPVEHGAAEFTQSSGDFTRSNPASRTWLWQCWQAIGWSMWFFIFYSIFLRMFLPLNTSSGGKQRQLFQEVTPAHRHITAPQPLQHPARGDVCHSHWTAACLRMLWDSKPVEGFPFTSLSDFTWCLASHHHTGHASACRSDCVAGITN